MTIARLVVANVGGPQGKKREALRQALAYQASRRRRQAPGGSRRNPAGAAELDAAAEGLYREFMQTEPSGISSVELPAHLVSQGAR